MVFFWALLIKKKKCAYIIDWKSIRQSLLFGEGQTKLSSENENTKNKDERRVNWSGVNEKMERVKGGFKWEFLRILFIGEYPCWWMLEENIIESILFA